MVSKEECEQVFCLLKTEYGRADSIPLTDIKAHVGTVTGINIDRSETLRGFMRKMEHLGYLQVGNFEKTPRNWARARHVLTMFGLSRRTMILYILSLWGLALNKEYKIPFRRKL